MKRIALTVAIFFTLAGPLAAQNFRAENRVNVAPVSGGFAIASGGNQGARGMWCAASDYASRVLGARGTQRIYVVGAQARGSRTPVVFSLNPGGATPSSVFSVGASIRTPGANLSVDHAHVFCADGKLINR